MIVNLNRHATKGEFSNKEFLRQDGCSVLRELNRKNWLYSRLGSIQDVVKKIWGKDDQYGGRSPKYIL